MQAYQENQNEEGNTKCVSMEMVDELRENYVNDKVNKTYHNLVTNVGYYLSSINTEESNKMSHVFMNSLKKAGVKATDQGSSGRCWLFAGLNMFRHNIINALNLENFEFSQTYLFFWDKFERANSYLQWFADHDFNSKNEREQQYMIMNYMDDGGYWNTFVSLVGKYGVVPKNAMPETYQSDWTDDMNSLLHKRVSTWAYELQHMRGKYSEEDISLRKNEMMREVYNILVKFLGIPPKEFEWSYYNEEDDGFIISKMTPMDFKFTTLPGLDLQNDFVMLVNIPPTRDDNVIKYYTKYNVRGIPKAYEAPECALINLPINELKKYVRKSLSSKVAVWFAADVGSSFDPMRSVLSDKVIDDKPVFGEYKELKKGEQIKYFITASTHAMCFTGMNVSGGKVRSWQVENSWGFYDHNVPGMDGFMAMSDSWFDKYVIQVVIHKNFLSRSIQRVCDSEGVELEPWSYVAPAIKVRSIKKPKLYLQKNGLKL